MWQIDVHHYAIENEYIPKNIEFYEILSELRTFRRGNQIVDFISDLLRVQEQKYIDLFIYY